MDTHDETPRDQATEVVETAKIAAQDQMHAAAMKGRGVLRAQVDQRSTQAGEQAESVARAIRRSASQMRASGDEQEVRYARVADQGAERLERVGGYLTEADADELLAKAEDVARQQPWLIAGAGVLVGIAVARFLKASSSERYYRISANGGYAQRPIQTWVDEARAATRPSDRPIPSTLGSRGEGQWQ